MRVELLDRVAEKKVVYEVAVPSGLLAPLVTDESVEVVSLVRPDVHRPALGTLVLVVVAGSAEMVRTLRRVYPGTPLLALLQDVAAAVPAMEAGADYVLARDAAAPLVLATYLAALREVDRRNRMRAVESALESVSDSVEIHASDGTLRSVNRAFEKMTGFERSEVENRPSANLVHHHVHDPRFFDEMLATLVGGKQWTGGLLARRRDGTLTTQLAVVKPVLDDGGVLRHVAAVKAFVPGGEPVAVRSTEHVTEHIHASISVLANSERRYRRMIEAASDAIWIVDFDTAQILEANTATSTMFGYKREELIGMTPRQLVGEGSEALVDRMARSLRETGSALEHRHPMTRKDGSRFWATVQLTSFDFMSRRQYMGVVRDVTVEVERQHALERSNRQLAETQTQLLHSSRLAALGQMAAGVAHEINNPLQYVLAGIEEIATLPEANTEAQQVLADMREGAERIRSVTRSLLPFARVDNAHQENIDLNEVIAWAVRVTGNEIRHRARLELRLADDLPSILGQRVRIGQLVTNLLSNAAHAITEGASERHSVRITTELVGRRVRLVVEDTGSGIPEDIRPRIFDPFFTTKPREVGTGLGLALCAEIVTRQGGTIEFESTIGMGSRFFVTFAESPQMETPRTPLPRVNTPPIRVGRGPRVLIIDDEEPLVRTYKRFLRGIEVIPAVGGKAALEILATDVDFDAIVCDLMMPSVDGPMVYKHIQEHAPQLVDRILFCSGGAFTTRVRSFLEEVPNLILDKPISPNQLRQSLDQLIKRD